LIVALAGAGFNLQMTIFLALSVVFLICLRPLSKRLIKVKKEMTNVDSLIGKDVLITKEVDNLRGEGEGKVKGMTWSVRSCDNSVISEGECAVAERVEGVKLIVKRKGE
jgi:membrane protein implicated in regulation of membrane protease activity